MHNNQDSADNDWRNELGYAFDEVAASSVQPSPAENYPPQQQQLYGDGSQYPYGYTDTYGNSQVGGSFHYHTTTTAYSYQNDHQYNYNYQNPYMGNPTYQNPNPLYSYGYPSSGPGYPPQAYIPYQHGQPGPYSMSSGGVRVARPNPAQRHFVPVPLQPPPSYNSSLRTQEEWRAEERLSKTNVGNFQLRESDDLQVVEERVHKRGESVSSTSISNVASINDEEDDDFNLDDVEEVDYKTESNSTAPNIDSQKSGSSHESGPNLEDVEVFDYQGDSSGSRQSAHQLPFEVPKPPPVPLNKILSGLGKSANKSESSNRNKRKRSPDPEADENDLTQFLGRSKDRCSSRNYAKQTKRDYESESPEKLSSAAASKTIGGREENTSDTTTTIPPRDENETLVSTSEKAQPHCDSSSSSVVIEEVLNTNTDHSSESPKTFSSSAPALKTIDEREETTSDTTTTIPRKDKTIDVISEKAKSGCNASASMILEVSETNTDPESESPKKLTSSSTASKTIDGRKEKTFDPTTTIAPKDKSRDAVDSTKEKTKSGCNASSSMIIKVSKTTTDPESESLEKLSSSTAPLTMFDGREEKTVDSTITVPSTDRTLNPTSENAKLSCNTSSSVVIEVSKAITDHSSESPEKLSSSTVASSKMNDRREENTFDATTTIPPKNKTLNSTSEKAKHSCNSSSSMMLQVSKTNTDHELESLEKFSSSSAASKTVDGSEENTSDTTTNIPPRVKARVSASAKAKLSCNSPSLVINGGGVGLDCIIENGIDKNIPDKLRDASLIICDIDESDNNVIEVEYDIRIRTDIFDDYDSD